MAFSPDRRLDVAQSGADFSGFAVRLDMGSAAFEGPQGGDEVARILRNLADRMDGADLHHPEQESYGTVVDANGNTCGFWRFTTDDEPLGRWPGGGPVYTKDL